MLVQVLAYEPDHLGPILALAAASEYGPTLAADPERAARALSSPGAIVVVALEGEELIGFAHTITDGAFQAYLCLLLVAPSARRTGVGRALVEATLERCGAIRVDLISSEEAEPFYRTFRYGGCWPGYRLYPEGAPGHPSVEG